MRTAVDERVDTDAYTDQLAATTSTSPVLGSDAENPNAAVAGSGAQGPRTWYWGAGVLGGATLMWLGAAMFEAHPTFPINALTAVSPLRIKPEARTVTTEQARPAPPELDEHTPHPPSPNPPPTPSTPPVDGVQQPAQDSTARVDNAADSDSTWDRIAACESSGNWAIDTGNGYQGGLQFLESTWKEFGGTKYSASADKATKAQQIEIARHVQAAQGWGAWPVCSRKAGVFSAGQKSRDHGSISQPNRPADGQPGDTYTVQQGDTLSRIAATHARTWRDLWEANRSVVTDPGKIFPGEQLQLSSSAQRHDTGRPTPDTHPEKPSASPPVVNKLDQNSAAQPSNTSNSAAQPSSTSNSVSAQSASTEMRIFLTGYSFQDNTPAGSAIVSHPILHNTAGGQGTFDDPITVASPGSNDSMVWQPGTKFYLPSIKRYAIVEDSGASPAPSGVQTHLDIWIGGENGTKSSTDACMDDLTGEVTAVLNPQPGLPVLPGPIFGQSCTLPQP